MIEKITGQIGKLTLVSNREGQVIGAPHRSGVGQWLKPGKTSDPEAKTEKPFFCEIGDPHHLEAHLILDQADIHLIKIPNDAWLKVHGKAETTFKSKVSEIAKRTSDEVPTELSNMAEGEVASKPDPKTGNAKPLTAVYEIIIPVENPNLELEPGLRGFAKIDGGSYTARLVAVEMVEQGLQLPALRRPAGGNSPGNIGSAETDDSSPKRQRVSG